MRTPSISSLSFLAQVVASILVGTALTSSATAQTADPLVRYFTRTTDLIGNEISSTTVGEQFKLEVFVQDLRLPPSEFSGVFSGATSVAYDESLTTPVMPLNFVHGPTFDAPISPLKNLSTAPDAIIGYGVRVVPTVPGNDPQLLFNIVLEASAPGAQSFLPTFFETADVFTLIYGTNDPLLESQILFQGSTLAVLVPEPGTWVGMLVGVAALWGFGFRTRPIATGPNNQQRPIPQSVENAIQLPPSTSAKSNV